MRFGSSSQKNVSNKKTISTRKAEERDPTPRHVLQGLKVQEKNLRELRQLLFEELLQLKVWHPLDQGTVSYDNPTRYMQVQEVILKEKLRENEKEREKESGRGR